MKITPSLLLNKFSYLLLAPLFLIAFSALADDSTKIARQVIASGGGTSSNSEYSFKSTIGQTGIGQSTINSIQVFSGFWPGYPLSCCLGTTGDLDTDGTDNTVLDLTFLINQIFRGGPDPLCPAEGDLDGNGISSQVLDLTAMINTIFRGGPDPAPCGSGL